MRVLGDLDRCTTDMQKEWVKTYKKLENFIEANPDIIIQEDNVVIPKAIRPIFYELFDKVRDTFIYEECIELLEKAESLSKGYLKDEQELMNLLSLEKVLMSSDVKRFLYEPQKQLARETFDLLFDLLNGKIDLKEFLTTAKVNVNSSFKHLYKKGYKKWIVISLIKQFKPDKIFYVPVNKPTSGQLIKHRFQDKEGIPFPVETKHIAFEVGGNDILLVPDVIIHSTILDQYVAFRTELGRATWEVENLNDNREWYSIASIIEKNGINDIRPDLLIYTSDNIRDISLVADSKNICRPDIIVEYLDDMDNNRVALDEKLQGVNFYNKVLEPTLGSFLLSMQDINKYSKDILEGNFNLVQTSYNNPQFAMIVNSAKKVN